MSTKLIASSDTKLAAPTGLEIKHITQRLETWRMKEWSDSWRDHKDYTPPHLLIFDEDISKIARKIHRIHTIDDLALCTQTVHFSALAPSLLEEIKNMQKDMLIQACSSIAKAITAPTDVELEKIMKRLTQWRTKVWREDWKDAYPDYSPGNLICDDDLDIIARDIHDVSTYQDLYERGSILHIEDLAPGILEELERIRIDIFDKQSGQVYDPRDSVQPSKEKRHQSDGENFEHDIQTTHHHGASPTQELDSNSHSDQFEIVLNVDSSSDSPTFLSTISPQALGGMQIIEITQRLESWRAKEWTDNWRNREGPPLVHHLLRDGDISVIARKINKIFTKEDLCEYTQIDHLEEIAPCLLNEIRRIQADIESKCRTSRLKKILRPTELQVEEIVKRLSEWRFKLWEKDWKDPFPFYSPLTLVSNDDLDIIARDILEVFTTDDLFNRAGIVHHNKIAPDLLEEVVRIRNGMFGEQAKEDSLDGDHILVSDVEHDDEWVVVDS